MPLRLRLTLFFTLFLAFVLVTVSATVYFLTQRSLVENLQDRLIQAVSQINSSAFLNEGVKTLPRDIYFESRLLFMRPERVDELNVDNIRGSFTFTADRGNPTPESISRLLSDDVYEELIQNGFASGRVRLESGNRLLVVATLALIRTDNNIERDVPPALVPLFVGLPLPTERLAQLRRLLLYTSLSAFAVFAVGVYILSRQVLLPVKKVTEAAAGVSGAELSQRVPVPKTRDEVQEMAVTLNHMLDRLEESFETQRRFTADASHELRTPVTAITGHANYLLRRTKPSPEQVDSLTVIRREGERMAKLVNDLLELARADAGFTVDRHPMNLVEVLEAVHMAVAPVAGHASIRVSAPQPLIEVLGDAARLKQVVLNLVQNALNAGATAITLSVLQEKNTVRLEVLDNGPGIPPEAVPHLFERFYRVDGARSTRGNGSGLGLAIVRWIVQQHHGEVEVESRLGEGTVFTVLLPALHPKKAEPKPAVSARGRSSVPS